jgi:hypothetical protein
MNRRMLITTKGSFKHKLMNLVLWLECLCLNLTFNPTVLGLRGPEAIRLVSPHG